jgi:hypothetical protein
LVGNYLDVIFNREPQGSLFVAQLRVVVYTRFMADKLVTVTGVNADGTPFSGQMVEADFRPTSSGFSGGQWHECVRCGHVDKEAAMSQIGGKWYCSYSGCNQEFET